MKGNNYWNNVKFKKKEKLVKWIQNQKEIDKVKENVKLLKFK